MVIQPGSGLAVPEEHLKRLQLLSASVPAGELHAEVDRKRCAVDQAIAQVTQAATALLDRLSKAQDTNSVQTIRDEALRLSGRVEGTDLAETVTRAMTEANQVVSFFTQLDRAAAALTTTPADITRVREELIAVQEENLDRYRLCYKNSSIGNSRC